MQVAQASSLPCVAFFYGYDEYHPELGMTQKIYLVTMLWAFNISNTRFRVIFLTKILQDLPCCFENLWFIHVMSKVFYHYAWCRRWPTLRRVKYSFEVLCLDSLDMNKRQNVFYFIIIFIIDSLSAPFISLSYLFD